MDAVAGNPLHLDCGHPPLPVAAEADPAIRPSVDRERVGTVAAKVLWRGPQDRAQREPSVAAGDHVDGAVVALVAPDVGGEVLAGAGRRRRGEDRDPGQERPGPSAVRSHVRGLRPGHGRSSGWFDWSLALPHPRAMLAGLVAAVRDITAGVDRMLAPIEVLERCRLVSRRDPRVERRIVGATEAGQPMEAYFFDGVPLPEAAVLLYGFPDPGEAIGATGIVALLEGFALDHRLLRRFPVAWALIPCLNLDDQPNQGRTLSHVFKSRSVRQVDLCADDPRSETRALLALANAVRPRLTLALHDEYHGDDEVPAYIGTTRVLPRDTCDRMRAALRAFGIPLSSTEDHPLMGAGFVDSRRYGSRYDRSAFPLLDRHGLVLTCEIRTAREHEPRTSSGRRSPPAWSRSKRSWRLVLRHDRVAREPPGRGRSLGRALPQGRPRVRPAPGRGGGGEAEPARRAMSVASVPRPRRISAPPARPRDTARPCATRGRRGGARSRRRSTTAT